MFSRILSGAVFGIESHLVHVEVDLSAGLPCLMTYNKFRKLIA